ncbi:hypothetical protein EKO29_11650 [Colwellia sp. Arc7-635]|uniref:hypothetical protein n=1 Tax=Colwellia sp. Arc7-635 TaxID=2497879 RepID=UPI000F851407|nr:hypothetical protein [Colwellia sp. Arc7-635]AZQ84611.1 hypothetical protein EKO29_11650 [Colwellia sp. Arc7-635]
MFIASSEYIAKQVDGTLTALTINIGAPELEPIPNGVDYRCKIEISELSICEYAYGVDAVQSLCLVVQCLRTILEPLKLAGWKFYFTQDLEHELDLLSALFPGHR